jgi:hypothetical protein
MDLDEGSNSTPDREPTGAEIVQRFRATASPTARKLAGLLAATDVSMPVVRIIQQTMLPESRQSHVAEVFLGGLLKEVTPADAAGHADSAQYDFLEGVRAELLGTLPVTETARVIQTISDFMEMHLGDARDFHAVLADRTGRGTISIARDSQRIASIRAAVLQRLGIQHAWLDDAGESQGEHPRQTSDMEQQSADADAMQEESSEQVVVERPAAASWTPAVR